MLAYTSPARGHVYPLVPVMLALRERGHRVSICTLSAELPGLRALGLEGRALDPAVECNQLEDWRRRSRALAARSVVRTLSQRAAPEVVDLARAIEREDPDVLLIDINCWGAAALAGAGERPWALYCPFPPPLPSPEVPPPGLGLAPARGPLGRLRDALGARLFEAVANHTVVRVVNAAHAQLGVPQLSSFAELIARVPLLLAFTAEGFEYERRRWPANVKLVGPLSWAPLAPAPAELDQLRDPLVLVTCSSERQRDERLVSVALQALPAAGMSVLATTAAHDPRAFAAPPGSAVLRFFPHEQVLTRAACVVCHGGMGITQKALRAGVPVVAVPFGRDQLEVARRVQVAGAGVRLPARQLDRTRLLRAVRAAVALEPGAQLVSEAFARAGGREAAVAAIEAIAFA